MVFEGRSDELSSHIQLADANGSRLAFGVVPEKRRKRFPTAVDSSQSRSTGSFVSLHIDERRLRYRLISAVITVPAESSF